MFTRRAHLLFLGAFFPTLGIAELIWNGVSKGVIGFAVGGVFAAVFEAFTQSIDAGPREVHLSPAQVHVLLRTVGIAFGVLLLTIVVSAVTSAPRALFLLPALACAVAGVLTLAFVALTPKRR